MSFCKFFLFLIRHPSSLPRPGTSISPGCAVVSLRCNPGHRGALGWPWNWVGCTPVNQKCKIGRGWNLSSKICLGCTPRPLKYHRSGHKLSKFHWGLGYSWCAYKSLSSCRPKSGWGGMLMGRQCVRNYIVDDLVWNGRLDDSRLALWACRSWLIHTKMYEIGAGRHSTFNETCITWFCSVLSLGFSQIFDVKGFHVLCQWWNTLSSVWYDYLMVTMSQ